MKRFQIIQIVLALLILLSLNILYVHTKPAALGQTDNSLMVHKSVFSVETQEMLDGIIPFNPGSDSLSIIQSLLKVLSIQQGKITEQHTANEKQQQEIQSLKYKNYTLRRANRTLESESEALFYELESEEALQEHLTTLDP